MQIKTKAIAMSSDSYSKVLPKGMEQFKSVSFSVCLAKSIGCSRQVGVFCSGIHDTTF